MPVVKNADRTVAETASHGTPGLVVVALGGNALAPAQHAPNWADEASAIEGSAAELARLARRGHRLLVVHGNGPQVGRLLAIPEFGDAARLDIHVAQTQGELGYQIAASLDRALGLSASVSLVTRVTVDPNDPAFAAPSKPVGAVLTAPPCGHASLRTPDGRGWRRVVASPRPLEVVESAAVRTLLRDHHVIAGGGGGIAISQESRLPVAAVVDKDWTAALLAIELTAEVLIFVTDVPHAYASFASSRQRALPRLTLEEAQQLLHAGAFAPGSMGPKVESAIQFAEARLRPAVIAPLGSVAEALAGEAGTTIFPPQLGGAHGSTPSG